MLAQKESSGLLDVPKTFLDPDRMNAGLMWFTRGFVYINFPVNARHVGKAITALDLSFELSSEVPGTARFRLAIRHHRRGQRPRA